LSEQNGVNRKIVMKRFLSLAYAGAVIAIVGEVIAIVGAGCLQSLPDVGGGGLTSAFFG
jgi:hypothetical protein